MSKFKNEFQEYKKACYPPEGQIHNPIQEKEVTQAFYAGAFAGYNILIEAMEKGEDIQAVVMEIYAELATKLKP